MLHYLKVSFQTLLNIRSTKRMSTNKDQNITEEVEKNVPRLQAGDLLRVKREQLGISQADMADRLRLRVAVIKSIDDNNYEPDQITTFTRGYVRSYAKAVSLDEKEIMAAFDGVHNTQHSEQDMQSFSRKTNREKHDRRLMKVTWIIVIALIGISSVWYYQNQQNSPSLSSDAEPNMDSEITQPLEVPQDSLAPPAGEPISPDRSQFAQVTVNTPEEVVAQPDITEANEPNTIEPVSEPISEPVASESVSDTSETLVNTQTTPQEPTESTSVALVNNNNIVMTFSADCWVQVNDADGKVLISKIRKAGTTLELSGKPPYRVVLGAPEGVSMTFANEPVDLSEYNSGRVARFTLP